MTAIAACHCQVCKNPAGDDAVQALHSDRHLAFERFRGERPDWGFRKPTFRQIVEYTAAEMSVSPGCVRLEDIGKPAHPVH